MTNEDHKCVTPEELRRIREGDSPETRRRAGEAAASKGRDCDECRRSVVQILSFKK